MTTRPPFSFTPNGELITYPSDMAAARELVVALAQQEEAMLVDPNCHDLAEWFLQSEPALRRRANELAVHIQEAIEDWIAAQKNEEPTSDTNYDTLAEKRMDEPDFFDKSGD